MFPPVTGLPKYNVNACFLRTCGAFSISEHLDVTIPQGATLIIDIPGLHYNRASISPSDVHSTHIQFEIFNQQNTGLNHTNSNLTGFQAYGARMHFNLSVLGAVLVWVASESYIYYLRCNISLMDSSFAETEVIATLTSLISMYKIELHPNLAGLDLSTLMDMVSDVKPGLSLWSADF